jgi:hypothetical protein
MALNTQDYDRMFNELAAPDMRLVNRSRSVFGDRSIAEFRASIEELDSMISSVRTWNSAARWLSPNWSIARQEREAIGLDGERFAWTRIYVGEVRDGRMASLCQFEPEDEAAAFAYAEERTRESASRLAVTNRASTTANAAFNALQNRDVDGTMAGYSERLEYDDRRRLSGNPITDIDVYRAAVALAMDQYDRFEWRILAVRGDRLALVSTCMSSEAGFESKYLHLFEVDETGLIVYEGRFDEENFDGAYRELEERYYRGEASAFAEAGNMTTDFTIAANQGDYDRIFGELSSPDFHVDNRTRSGFPDRPSAEFRASLDELRGMVTSLRTWSSAVCWLSRNWVVSRLEREALDQEGERFSWTRVVASEVIDGRVASMCAFEPEDEDQAFAYAQEHVQTTASRLAVTNRASERSHAARQAAQDRDVDAMVDCYVESFVYDDRRQLSGNPLGDRRSAAEGILAQYTRFEGHTLAVRGERLCLSWSRWRNDEGFETSYLIVHEVDDSGRFIYEGRFDEDNFNAAYRELERRYCAGEGAEFSNIAMLGAEYLIAINEGAYDRVVDELTAPGMRVENRTLSGFPDRSVTELGASFEELKDMVGPTRSWNSAAHWLSPECGVVRHEREAFGPDGEHYTWTFFVVFEASNDRATHLCQFELDDEAAAFAYAEEQVRQTQQR